MTSRKAHAAGLSEAQRVVLASCEDWTMPVDIADRLGWLNSGVLAARILSILQDCVACGFLEHDNNKNLYRITDAGRAALSQVSL